MLFSIIVPIYKVEAYLQECIDSVLCQSWQSYELILVDDGSPDTCPRICDNYASEDERIRVIHQGNKGLSGARNAGLHAAKGDYIFFLDGDDVMYPEALSNIASDLFNSSYPDFLTGNIIHWDGNHEEIRYDNRKYIHMQKSLTLLEFIEFLAVNHWNLSWEAYHSVYNRLFLEKNGLAFKEHLVGAEDCDFWIKVISKAKSYKWTTSAFVKYRCSRKGSIMATPSIEQIMGRLETFSNAMNKSEIFPNPLIMKRYFAKCYLVVVCGIWALNEAKDRKYCARFVHENEWVFNYIERTPKTLFMIALIKILGAYYGSAVLYKLTVLLRFIHNIQERQ